MAILKGFPPSNTISPSVRITERDLTYTATTPTLQNIGLVGFASKGPFNTPTLVSTLPELALKFGNPHPDTTDPYLIYAAQQALITSNSVYVVRVGDVDSLSPDQAQVASVDLQAAGGLIKAIGSTANPGTTTKDHFFKWKLNGVESSKTLVLSSGTNGATAYVNELNDQLDFAVDGIKFSVYVDSASAEYVAVESVWAYGTQSTIEFLSITDGLMGPDSPIGLGTGMTFAELGGTASHYPQDAYHSAGQWDFSSFVGPLNLQIVVDGTENGNIDGIIQVLDLDSLKGLSPFTSTSDLVDELNALVEAAQAAPAPNKLPGGFSFVANGSDINVRTVDATSDIAIVGRGAKLAVKKASTGAIALGLTNGGTYNYVSGLSDKGTSATDGIITGTANTAGDISLTITADSAGIEGNVTSIQVTENVGGTFNILVFNEGNPVEQWGDLTKDPASRYYFVTYINLVSDWIRAVDNTNVSAPPAPLDVPVLLAGGSDGLPEDPDAQDDLIIGSPVSYTGLYAFSEPDQLNIDLLAAPGRSSTRVIENMIIVCEQYRQDCLAIIDPPISFSPREIIQWQNGVHPLNNRKLDSDFAALYWPWVAIRDGYNGLNVFAPPSGSVLATIARSDSIAFPWFAPAGLTRGVCPGVLGVQDKPTALEKDQMYGNGNAINPIISYAGSSNFVIWGQKTLQRRPTALDRINVRRMLFYIEKAVKNVSQSLLFEPHTDQLRERFVTLAQRIIDPVKINQGIYDYIIKCDEDLNPPDVIDRNEMRARIGVQPVRAAEFIFIEFSLHRTGTFNENTEVLA